MDYITIDRRMDIDFFRQYYTITTVEEYLKHNPNDISAKTYFNSHDLVLYCNMCDFSTYKSKLHHNKKPIEPVRWKTNTHSPHGIYRVFRKIDRRYTRNNKEFLINWGIDIEYHPEGIAGIHQHLVKKHEKSIGCFSCSRKCTKPIYSFELDNLLGGG